jgi:AraC-like DNA-binding protein
LDPLAALISLLRPQTVFSKLISGAGRWSIRYDRAQDHAAFCVMLEGACLFDGDGIGVLELEKGDALMLPETPSFTLACDLALTPKIVVPTTSLEVRHGAKSGRVTMRMLGGYFRLDRTNVQLLRRLLPPAIHIRRADAGAGRARRIVELIAEQAGTHRPGRELILDRLVEVLLIESLRTRAATTARQEHGLLAGLSDATLARSLHAIHRDVARRWTVAELARVAGMSRAVFAERFTRTVGMPPMQYLLDWRMAIATDVLRRERPPLAAVAERVGYQSTSAFSTAFSRSIGCSPKAFVAAVDRVGP